MIAEDRLARAFLESHPARAALILAQMPVARAAAVLAAVPARVAATALREMTVAYASDCIDQLDAPAAAPVLTELNPGDAAGVIRALKPERREPVLAALAPAVRDPVMRMLQYPDGTAGAVMDPTIFHLPADIIVADARARLLRAAHELLYYLYIVDRDRRLIGVLDIPELMHAPARARVSALMHRDVHYLSVWVPVALVRQNPGWHRFHAMPVVDEEMHLLGAIRYQTLRKLERDASGVQEPAGLTAGALAELFQLSTTGMVAGLAATAAALRDSDRAIGEEVADAG
jgi:magnesium transporter